MLNSCLQKAVVHPAYGNTPSNNDVALLKLDAPVTGVPLAKLAQSQVRAVRPWELLPNTDCMSALLGGVFGC